MRKYLLSIVTNQISILRSFHAELVSKTLKQDEKSRGMSWTWTMYCPSQARNQKKKRKNIWNKNDRHTWLAMDILVAPYTPGNSADLAKSESALTGFVIIE